MTGDGRSQWRRLLDAGLDRIADWESEWPERSLEAPSEAHRAALGELAERLRETYPFFHPRYAGQMLKPPHPVAWTAYAMAALQNPNNHARDGGPATADLEVEAVALLAAMMGVREPFLGHLTGGGTVANLEALWVARELHPGRALAISAGAHYTHKRVAHLLGMKTVTVPVDASGRMDVDSLREVLDDGVGTIVATLGTTGLGALDPIDEIAELARSAGARLHVDAAYGGFFSLLARRQPPLVDVAPFSALSAADSIVIDPHKHGLQPYGAGCVIFRDPDVSRFYGHDSPYTYFTSGGHLGEIAFECSRPGASAAALWATLKAIPLEPEAGLGEMLAAGRRAALAWSDAIASSAELRLFCPPQTDILVFAPRTDEPSASAISAASAALFELAMADPQDAVYLAKIRLPTDRARRLWPDLVGDQDEVVLLRSVLMKPAHELEWPAMHRRLCALVASGLTA